MLTLENFTCYRGKTLVLKDVNLQLSAGECVVVQGANGVGKSTLLRAAARLIEGEGKINWTSALPPLYLPVHLKMLTPASLTQTLAWQIQMLPVSSRGCSREEALARFALDPYATHDVTTLSEGMKKRLLLTRLLFQKADLWIVDEPTEFLDEKGLACWQAVTARHLECGGAVITATHRLQDFMPLNPRCLQLTPVREAE